MQAKAFFKEIKSHIPEMNNVRFEVTDDSLNVFINDKKEFYVKPQSGISCVEGCNYNNKFYDVYYNVEKAAKLVKEYTSALCDAPMLDGEGINGSPLRKLAEFGNVVLAGSVSDKESTIEFVTCSGHIGGMEICHYFGNDYIGAKEDFCKRTNLVNENKVFSDKELVEIHRCIEDTFDREFKLTDEQTEMLENIQTKIKSSVDNFGKPIGNKIAENFVSATAIKTLAQNIKNYDKKTVFEICNDARSGNLVLQELFFEMGENLGKLITEKQKKDTFNEIVFGGGVSLSWDLFQKGFDSVCNIPYRVIENPNTYPLYGVLDCVKKGKAFYCNILEA